MAYFGEMSLTNAGLNLLTNVQAGTDKLSFTKMVLGDGELLTEISTLTEPVSPKFECSIDSGKRVGENTYQIGAFFSNTSIVTGFWWREIAIYAKGSDEMEVLYCYANAGDAGDYIPVGRDERIEKYIYVSLGIGNAENITIEINENDTYIQISEKGKPEGVVPLNEDGKIDDRYLPDMNYVPIKQYEEMTADLSKHKKDTNPHNITASTVGLEKVPNVTTNEQTPTYTEASTLANLISGEKLSIAFGKIKKGITSLMLHLSDVTKHITSEERVKWNKAQSTAEKSAFKLLTEISTPVTLTAVGKGKEEMTKIQISGIDFDKYEMLRFVVNGTVDMTEAGNASTGSNRASIGITNAGDNVTNRNSYISLIRQRNGASGYQHTIKGAMLNLIAIKQSVVNVETEIETNEKNIWMIPYGIAQSGDYRTCLACESVGDEMCIYYLLENNNQSGELTFTANIIISIYGKEIDK